MSEVTTRFSCPVCGRFLGITDGDHFEPPPCQCGWQVVMRRVKRLPKNKEKMTGSMARL